MSRRVAIPLAVVILGGALGLLLVRATLDDDDERALIDRCATVGPGDTAEEVFARLGLEGYRPGCGSVTPCDRVDLGGYQSIPWLCDPEDCSLLWRAGPIGCFVDLDPETRVVLDVVPMDHSEAF